MSGRLRKNLDQFKKLGMAKTPELQEEILRGSSRQFIIALVEVIANILKENVPLKASERKKLKKHADVLRALGRARTESKARKIINQTGSGPIVALIPSILAAAISLLT